MFERLDRHFFAVRMIINIVTGILIAAYVIGGTILTVFGLIAIGLPLLLAGPIVMLAMWVSAHLMLSFLCDVKLIRNKLYGESNEDLERYYLKKSDRQGSAAPAKPSAPEPDNGDLLAQLNELSAKGVITEEEYNEQFKKIFYKKPW